MVLLRRRAQMACGSTIPFTVTWFCAMSTSTPSTPLHLRMHLLILLTQPLQCRSTPRMTGGGGGGGSLLAASSSFFSSPSAGAAAAAGASSFFSGSTAAGASSFF
uniref:Uncharacterized protein n=1 Tax=Arundo donax TaxID=35708 RepID=A0A0A9HI96_ARUDO